MRPQLHKLPTDPDSSFIFRELKLNHFPHPWHFHKEFELVLIDKSSGTRFIGDNVGRFNDGDLCLIGPYIPHLYRNDEIFYHSKKKLTAQSIFIHFTEDSLSKDFFELPEMKVVQTLLAKSSQVVEIHGQTKIKATKLLYEMRNDPPVKRLLKFIELLITLGESNESTTLLTFNFSTLPKSGSERINTALQFILKNFRSEVSIAGIAGQLNMSVPAFSRYFKNHTRKTFTDYVTEVRIGYACKLLIENSLSISEIGYKSGFENLSNFYRHFKKVKNMVPKDYRKQFLSN
ncbi:AraC family transcriptional regulator [Niabella sp. CC-SYL272]|uniref:AraC family transcriptional regulator n=1 Tax=Niabella agricola TaxID=2891571 RepID=UPI001F1F425D|nr:AraC family transcriptional regulator [Niabella agricola]MCF3108089.1 AraC family transcriptional regulator [Niabella agricola]